MKRQYLALLNKNGIAERMNCTIDEKARCMLKMANFPKLFWGESIRTACYLINRSSSAPLNFDIPERVSIRQNVSYSYLKVFGCKAFAHVPKEKRLKLDDKAIPCIYIGYGYDEFGYPEKKEIIRSKDVVFYEHEILTDSKSINPKVMADGVFRFTPISSQLDTLTDGGAQSHKDKDNGLKSMQEKMSSLQKNSTYEFVELPKGRKALMTKWVFKLKKDDNKLVKYKARMVVKSFGQKKGIDFNEIFSLVVKMSSIHVSLGLAASLDLELE
ncbi:hypothetical protein RJ639_008817 [Escallonia herrerae]|uniref:Retrovirus-related Pol polyprotein from transposon TNT 1-94 n=1 Tax=Escallonia herrerae TaxID=1293975 RepID=A0AA88VVK1_9ASTE|nr:hypothetical protein RJ639_008817 [Escallonia herrerae]